MLMVRWLLRKGPTRSHSELGRESSLLIFIFPFLPPISPIDRSLLAVFFLFFKSLFVILYSTITLNYYCSFCCCFLRYNISRNYYSQFLLLLYVTHNFFMYLVSSFSYNINSCLSQNQVLYMKSLFP